MGIALTDHQLKIVKGIVEIAEATANQLYHIIENHGLNKVEGFKINIDVDPESVLCTRQVDIGWKINVGREGTAGAVCLTRGKKDEKYILTGKNSAEYEWLFADEAVKERMRQILDAGTHPLPPDGLWVGADRNSDPVDGWEWDINDSLS